MNNFTIKLNKSYFFIKLCTLIGILFFSSMIVSASNLPDYYSEPGFNSFRSYTVGEVSEVIDPFSGGLNLVYQDIIIPGNNGLDLVVTRSYRSLQGRVNKPGSDYKQWSSPLGIGWDIHFGRVWTSQLSGSTQSACKGNPLDANANPVLELPDGTRKLMLNSNNSDYAFISKDRWVMRCESNGDYLLAYSPDGLIYKFGYYTYSTFNFAEAGSAYHVTEISDLNGNKIKIDYLENTQHGIIDKAYFSGEASKGITFKYSEPLAGFYQLDKIEANGQTWEYDFKQVLNAGVWHVGYYYLMSAKPPEGNPFQYEYQEIGNRPGLYSLNKVQTPGSTSIQYDYQRILFANFGPYPDGMISVKTKTVAGGNVASGTWQYSFNPGSSVADDTTTITAPSGEKTEYQHFGIRRAKNGSVWKIGTLSSQSDFASNGQLIRKQAYTWSNEQISTQNVKSRRNSDQDTAAYAPLLTNKTITQDDMNYSSTFSDFEYGQPTRIIENGSDNRTITLDYQHLTNTNNSQWKLFLLKKREISNVSGNISYSYDSKGNLTSANQYGVTNTYLRCANGEVSIQTNPNGNRTKYLCGSYDNGIPRNEELGYGSADSVIISRTVNNDGTIASETRAGKTTSYQWDDLNRITKITTPSSGDADISISWNSSGTQQVLSRGSFSSVQKFDGLGRLTSKVVDGIDTRYTHDAQGRKITESNMGAISTKTQFSYDALNRLKVVNPPGNGTIQYQYNDNRVSIRDERGYTTTMTYRTYGDPDQKSLVKIDSPESITTLIDRDGLDNIRSVTQGGMTRVYSYNPRYQLTSISHPEIGLEVFGRDPLGNMISHKVANNAATGYTYDALERLININYAASNTPDITYTYDQSGNLASASRDNGYSWTYQYSNNNILTQEKLTLASEAKSFPFYYELDGLDNISYITYPSGIRYKMKTNNLGRITDIDITGVKSIIDHATYWPNGAVNTITYANGYVSEFTQNDRYRTTQATTSNTVFNTTYGYDSSGNMNSLIDYVDSTHSLNSLNYDGLNRLTTINNVTVLSFDQKSNIKTNKLAGLNLTYQYDAANRLASISNSSYDFAYDSRGNMTNNGSHQYTYNEANELTSVIGQNWTMQYDGHHYRTVQQKAGGKIFTLYTRSGKIMYESNEITGDALDYIYLGSHLVARNELCLNQTLDSDNDGLPNCFEMQIGLSSQNPQDAYQDLDGDGLNNLQEYQYGTNALSIDTDNDGVQDHYEVHHSMNPLLHDSASDLDGDGWTNLQEYQAGTKANSADSDGDGIIDSSDDDPLFNIAAFIPIMMHIMN